MFRSADELLLEAREKDFQLHVLGFGWSGFEPSLECEDIRGGEVLEVDLEDVRFWVSARKTCVGYFDDDGKHVPCPTSAEVGRFTQCSACARVSFIPDQECVFDPKCDGNSETCSHPFCRREHVLYLAFYDTHAKIGMSSSKRVDRRLVEQGADAFSVFGSFSSRKGAREAERRLSAELGVPQSFRQEMLLRNLSKPVDRVGIERRYEDLKGALASLGYEPGGIVWLEGYPIHLPLREPPILQKTQGRHKGEFLGVKGRWLVYEKSGVRALNLSDMPARWVSVE